MTHLCLYSYFILLLVILVEDITYRELDGIGGVERGLVAEGAGQLLVSVLLEVECSILV